MRSRTLACVGFLAASQQGCAELPPCEPKACLERANAVDYGRGDREEALTYLERACRGGLSTPCARYAAIIRDQQLAAVHGATAKELLVHGCRELRSGLVCMSLADENGDDIAILDEGCTLGEERACSAAAYKRSQSRDAAERRRVLPYYETRCRADGSECARLLQLQESVGELDAARATRGAICERDGGKECTAPAFDAAVGRDRTPDSVEARRLARRTCPATPPGLEGFGHPPECEALSEVEAYLKRAPGTTLALVVGTSETDRVELAVPPGFELPVGSHLSRGLPGLIVNSSTTFEARVVEARPGRLVVIQEAMQTPSMAIKVGVLVGSLLLIRFEPPALP